ncbi:MAG TPA: metallophosphoesterase family protein [Gemmatimonadales bacterium]|nr:metallophosphoesterase family protein [Gemmatimonadales bacterium]
MRIGLLADLHANDAALRAVLDHLAADGVREIVCLGDLVGYHARMHETLALVRERQIPSVAGNHDLMAIGRLPMDGCGRIARGAITWTRNELTAEEWDYLETLPAKIRLWHGIACMHARPGNPVTRLVTPEDFRTAAERLRLDDGGLRICCLSHTYGQQAVSIVAPGATVPHLGPEVRLPRGAFTFINPGSVGRSRDGDPRAAFAVIDTSRWSVSFRRVAYDATNVRPAEVPRRQPSRALAASVFASSRTQRSIRV